MRRRGGHLARQVPVRTGDTAAAAHVAVAVAVPPVAEGLLHCRAIDRDTLPVAAGHTNRILVPQAAVHEGATARPRRHSRCRRRRSKRSRRPAAAVVVDKTRTD